MLKALSVQVAYPLSSLTSVEKARSMLKLCDKIVHTVHCQYTRGAVVSASTEKPEEGTLHPGLQTAFFLVLTQHTLGF